MSRYIDADALNDAMYHEAFENDVSYDERNPMAKWDSGLWIRYKMFENAIADAPSIDIEPKRGEWIRTFDGNEWYWYCSNCKTQWYEDDLWMGGNEFPHFCPNCGADMRERKESE